MAYDNDLIIADTDAMEEFLNVASSIKNELNTQIRDIDRKYKRIANWEDDIQYKTGELIDKIEDRANLLSDNIDNLNKNFGLLIDDLRGYNNANTGKFGRL